MIGPLVHGILLGLGAAAPIGPINVEMARRTLSRGMRSGQAVGLGAVTVDGFYAAMVGLGLQRVVRSDVLRTPLGIAGSLLLAYLAFGCLRSAARRLTYLQSGSPQEAALDPAEPSPSLRGAYLTGVLMTLLNPMTLAWWFVAVPAQVTTADGGGLAFILMVVGVMVGAVAWALAFCWVLSHVPVKSRAKGLMLADLFGGLLLAGFAVLAAWKTLANAGAAAAG